MSVEYDHDAIYKAYPNASRIFDAEGVFDGDDNLIEIDQALVDAARVPMPKDVCKTTFDDLIADGADPNDLRIVRDR